MEGTRNWIWHARNARVPAADARYTSNGIPPRPFRNLGDYIDYQWDSTIYLLTDLKTSGYEVLGGRSFREFVVAGKAVPARGWDGRHVRLSPTRAMLDGIHQDGWLAAKLHYRFDEHTNLVDVRRAIHRRELGDYCERHLVGTYVENRICGVAPFGEEGAAPALTVGLIEMLDEEELILQTRTWDEWRSLWLQASERGLDLACPQTLRIIGELLQLAAIGLRRRGAGEEMLLAPLFERLQTQRAPADEMIEAFSRGGVPAIVERFGAVT